MPVQGKHRFGGGEEQRVAATTGEKMHSFVGLPLVRFKEKGNLSVGDPEFGFGGSIQLLICGGGNCWLLRVGQLAVVEEGSIPLCRTGDC